MEGNNVRKRKVLILIVILSVVVLAVASVIFFVKDKQTPLIEEPDTTGTVIIDNTDGLSSILLGLQYQATSDFVIEYIQKEVGQGIEHAVIVGAPEVNKDGSVDFKVKTDAPETQFTVHIDRSSVKNITLQIRNTNYKRTVEVY